VWGAMELGATTKTRMKAATPTGPSRQRSEPVSRPSKKNFWLHQQPLQKLWEVESDIASCTRDHTQGRARPKHLEYLAKMVGGWGGRKEP
jgi:hypothetical protein